MIKPLGKINLSRPWCFKVSIAEGCNKYCDFCGLRSIRTGAGENIQIMTPEIAEFTAYQIRDLNPEARLEIGGFGEPLLNTDINQVVATFRNYLPKSQLLLVSNGKLLVRKMLEKIPKLFESGVDILFVDMYKEDRGRFLRELVPNISTFEKEGIIVWDYYRDCVPNKWSPYSNHRRKYSKILLLVDDISEVEKNSGVRQLHNSAGNSPNTDADIVFPIHQSCTRLFREMSIDHTGTVNLCCTDWGNEAVFGNVCTDTLEDIWYGEKMDAYRCYLGNKKRDMTPCSVCDYFGGFRKHISPRYPEPTAKEEAIVLNVLKNTIPKNGKVFSFPDSAG